MTDKISIDSFVIEVTRRCNMECGHCLRGEPEKLDMNPKYIEDIVKQCDYISCVTFTGGEPSLYVDAIYDFINLVKKYGVCVDSFYVATNGKDIGEDFLIACCKLYAMCDGNEISSVQISNDEYHKYENDYDGGLLKALSFFSNKEMDDPKVRHGGYTRTWINEGRYADDYGDGRVNSTYRFDLDDGRICEETIYLNCEGVVIAGCDWSYESQLDEENIICRSDQPLFENVMKWNEKNHNEDDE